MRPHEKLVHSRTRVAQRYALMPLEGYPVSRLPGWPLAEVRVLASPALGARFVQYLIDLPGGGEGAMAGVDGIETFFIVLEGSGEHIDPRGEARRLEPMSFGLTPPAAGNRFRATEPLRLLIHQKRYQPSAGVEMFRPLYGRADRVAGSAWADTDRIQLQTLIPDELQYDMAMNIFTFTPGFGLPIIETHVMEHGLLFLQGKGVYRLGEEWIEVEKDDFIWMGPYCPQSFYATGGGPAKYIYYKDVNREIML